MLSNYMWRVREDGSDCALVGGAGMVSCRAAIVCLCGCARACGLVNRQWRLRQHQELHTARLRLPRPARTLPTSQPRVVSAVK